MVWLQHTITLLPYARGFHLVTTDSDFNHNYPLNLATTEP